MARYRSFIFPEATVSEKTVTLEQRESHHLVKVFRARAGEAVELLDGKGRRYDGRIARADAKAAVVDVERVAELPEPAVRITLLQSLPKGKTMDLILRMATEIGVSVVQPIYTNQSEVHLAGDRMQSKAEKWRGTMIESCKQCGLGYLPELNLPLSLGDWLANGPSERELRIVASLEEGSHPLLQTLEESMDVQEVVIAVGPEGDFSADEYAAMRAAGFRGVRLGNNVLRAETAAAYIMSVVDQFFQRPR